MNIAFIKSNPHILPSSGVKLQALIWKKELENLGHEITLINCWENTNWNDFDIALFFEYGEYLKEFV